MPLVSLSVDFYVRVFIRVYTSAAESKRSANKLAYVWQSQGCDSFYLQRVGQVRGHLLVLQQSPCPCSRAIRACVDTLTAFVFMLLSMFILQRNGCP